MDVDNYIDEKNVFSHPVSKLEDLIKRSRSLNIAEYLLLYLHMSSKDITFDVEKLRRISQVIEVLNPFVRKDSKSKMEKMIEEIHLSPKTLQDAIEKNLLVTIGKGRTKIFEELHLDSNFSCTIIWCKSNFVYKDDSSILKQEVYYSYLAFCESISISPLGSVVFTDLLQTLFPDVRLKRPATGTRAYVYSNLSMKTNGKSNSSLNSLANLEALSDTVASQLSCAQYCCLIYSKIRETKKILENKKAHAKESTSENMDVCTLNDDNNDESYRSGQLNGQSILLHDPLALLNPTSNKKVNKTKQTTSSTIYEKARRNRLKNFIKGARTHKIKEQKHKSIVQLIKNDPNLIIAPELNLVNVGAKVSLDETEIVHWYALKFKKLKKKLSHISGKKLNSRVNQIDCSCCDVSFDVGGVYFDNIQHLQKQLGNLQIQKSNNSRYYSIHSKFVSELAERYGIECNFKSNTSTNSRSNFEDSRPNLDNANLNSATKNENLNSVMKNQNLNSAPKNANSNSATQNANSNSATQNANSNFATNNANLNSAPKNANSNSATQNANSNFATKNANLNSATKNATSNSATKNVLLQPEKTGPASTENEFVIPTIVSIEGAHVENSTPENVSISIDDLLSSSITPGCNKTINTAAVEEPKSVTKKIQTPMTAEKSIINLSTLLGGSSKLFVGGASIKAVPSTTGASIKSVSSTSGASIKPTLPTSGASIKPTLPTSGASIKATLSAAPSISAAVVKPVHSTSRASIKSVHSTSGPVIKPAPSTPSTSGISIKSVHSTSGAAIKPVASTSGVSIKSIHSIASASENKKGQHGSTVIVREPINRSVAAKSTSQVLVNNKVVTSADSQIMKKLGDIPIRRYDFSKISLKDRNHSSIQRLFKSYKHVVLPKRVLTSDVDPVVVLNSGEVWDWYNERLDRLQNVEQKSPTVVPYESQVTLKRKKNACGSKKFISTKTALDKKAEAKAKSDQANNLEVQSDQANNLEVQSIKTVVKLRDLTMLKTMLQNALTPPPKSVKPTTSVITTKSAITTGAGSSTHIAVKKINDDVVFVEPSCIPVAVDSNSSFNVVNLKCAFCLKVFFNTDQLTYHEKIHLSCKKCKRRFKNSEVMIKHLRNHCIINARKNKPRVRLDRLPNHFSTPYNVPNGEVNEFHFTEIHQIVKKKTKSPPKINTPRHKNLSLSQTNKTKNANTMPATPQNGHPNTNLPPLYLYSPSSPNTHSQLPNNSSPLQLFLPSTSTSNSINSGSIVFRSLLINQQSDQNAGLKSVINEKMNKILVLNNNGASMQGLSSPSVLHMQPNNSVAYNPNVYNSASSSNTMYKVAMNNTGNTNLQPSVQCIPSVSVNNSVSAVNQLEAQGNTNFQSSLQTISNLNNSINGVNQLQGQSNTIYQPRLQCATGVNVNNSVGGSNQLQVQSNAIYQPRLQSASNVNVNNSVGGSNQLQGHSNAIYQPRLQSASNVNVNNSVGGSNQLQGQSNAIYQPRLQSASNINVNNSVGGSNQLQSQSNTIYQPRLPSASSVNVTNTLGGFNQLQGQSNSIYQPHLQYTSNVNVNISVSASNQLQGQNNTIYHPRLQSTPNINLNNSVSTANQLQGQSNAMYQPRMQSVSNIVNNSVSAAKQLQGQSNTIYEPRLQCASSVNADNSATAVNQLQDHSYFYNAISNNRITTNENVRMPTPPQTEQSAYLRVKPLNELR